MSDSVLVSPRKIQNIRLQILFPTLAEAKRKPRRDFTHLNQTYENFTSVLTKSPHNLLEMSIAFPLGLSKGSLGRPQKILVSTSREHYDG